MIKPQAKRPHSDYDVGYKQPPRATQFQKGQSGNPNGRPRKLRKPGKATALIDSVRLILEQPITIMRDGREEKITKRNALIEQLIKDMFEAPVAARIKIFEILLQLRALEPHPGQTRPSKKAMAQFIDGLAKIARDSGADFGDDEAPKPPRLKKK